ncbi:MAG: hypothetical protein IPM46_06260 [Flavobacteriales bacterium]|nr:hypothetical protein [Flavobacteriales bacterium]
MMHELKARAKYEVGERVTYHGAPWFVIARYWRRSTDEILYDLKEDLGKLKIHAKTRRKVDEGEIGPGRRG